MKRKQGFTVIELMIVLVIVAILLALAYPSYVNYVRKGKRGDAQQILMNWAVNQEIFRSNHPAYAPNSTDPNVGIPAPAPTNEYQYEVTGTSPTSYELRAIAQGDQAKDKARNGTICSPLTLNQNGQKEPVGCWE